VSTRESHPAHAGPAAQRRPGAEVRRRGDGDRLHLDALDDKARTGASTTLKEATIAKLPLQGRNFTSLILTDPRVASYSGGPSFAGQNNRLNNIQIDGGANNDLFGLADNGTPAAPPAASRSPSRR